MPGFEAVFELSSLDGTNGFRINGEAAYDRSGTSVASAGDVNGDGFDDLIIGAPSADPNDRDSGASYVVFGQAGGFASNIELADLDGTNGFRISGEALYDQSGRSVASAGDVNGDGFDDLIVGAPYADPTYSGASYVVFGQAGGFSANIDVSDLDGTNGFQIRGAEHDESGFSVASAGDVNGDGFADLIVGAIYGGDYGSGASYVVFGHAGGFAAEIDLSNLDGTNGFQVSGEAALDQSGWSVASAGDVNGDGFDDLIIGARWADPNGLSSGASYVVFGQAGGFSAEIELSDLDGTNGFQINGEAERDYSGFSVASAGDVNGDGFDDLIVGAFNGGSAFYAGASYVVFGQAGGFSSEIELSGLDGTNGFQITGEEYSSFSGFSVASAGDVNGDGFDDLIIGAPSSDPSAFGASYVVFGQAGGFSAEIELSDLDGSNGFQISGELRDASGRSVASAGDVNGDGFDDLIIGASGAGPNGDLSGSSYVVFGQATVDPIGTDDADLLVGSDFPDQLDGRGGNDTLDGRGANDRLDGGGGDDTMHGGAGNDVLNGGNGDDTLDGGEGIDTADYSYRTGGITATLTGSGDGIAKVGSVTETLTDIENLTGGAGVDGLTGDAGDNELNGGAGNDVLSGGLGDDTLIGGGGIDTADYSYRTGGITVTLTGSGDATAQIGSVTETLTGIENVTGGSGGDALTGDAGDNVLNGGAGNDVLNGGLGDDTLIGGADADVLVFGDNDGADLVTDFENGSDTIDLSAVDDVSRFRDLDITDTGGGVLIDYGTGTIELDNVASATSIDRGDFIFA